MTAIANSPATFPDHTQLPESDGTFAKNFQEHPQSILYHLLAPNERGHYPITPLGVELGIWQGQYQNLTLPWLRWWDEKGNLLLTGSERAERLAAQLRTAGIEPEV